MLKTPTFYLILAALLLVGGASGTNVHLVPYLTQRGLSTTAAVGAISIVFVFGATVALLIGVLSERIPPRILLALVCLVCAASMMVLYVADTVPEAYLFAAMQGTVRSGVNTLAPLVWADSFGRASLGSIIGFSRASQVVGFAVGPLVLGLVFDATGSYQGTFIYYSLVAVVAAAMVFAARRPRRPVAEPGTALRAAAAGDADN